MKRLILFSAVVFSGLFLNNPAACAFTCSPGEVMVGAWLFDSPGKMAVTRGGKAILVLDEMAAGIKIVDTSENMVLGQIDLPFEQPVSISLSPDMNRAYVSAMFQGSIAVIDISGERFDRWKIVDTWEVASGPGTSLGPVAVQGSRLYVVDYTAGAVRILSLSDGSEDAPPLLASTGACGLISDLVVTEERLFAGCEVGNVVAVFDLAKMAFEKNILVGNGPVDLLLSPGGDTLFTACIKDGAISLIDTGTLTVTGTVKNDNILSMPSAMAWMDGDVWITDRANASVVKLDTGVMDLDAGSCRGLGSYPGAIAAVEELETLYVAQRYGVNFFSIQGSVKLYVRQQGDSDYTRRIDLILEPSEVFKLRIDGGSGSFEVSGSGGLSALNESGRVFTVTAPLIEGKQTLYVEDRASGEKVSLFLRVGGALRATPENIPDMEIGGMSRVISASGGFPPYAWTTEQGHLSATSGRYVVYTPLVTGEDIVTLRDSGGSSVTVGVRTTSSGIRVTPAMAILLPGEERTFTALGGNQYLWEAPLGGIISHTEGQETLFTAPLETGDYTLLVSDINSGESANAKISVIQDTLEITPAGVEVEREAATSFSVVGGRGPYLWSVGEGDLSSTEGRSVFYTAPAVSGETTIQVRDIGGRVAVGRINIGRQIRISPVSPVVYRGESMKFSLGGAWGKVGWTCSDGILAQESDDGVGWTAPGRSGTFHIIASDDRGDSTQAVVRVVSGSLALSPSILEIKAGEPHTFRVSGGSPPYSWSADTGTLSSGSGAHLYWTAPLWVPGQPVHVLVSDSAGEGARAVVTVVPGDPGIRVDTAMEKYTAGDTIRLKINTAHTEGWDIYSVLSLPGGLAWFTSPEGQGIRVQDAAEKWSYTGMNEASWISLLELQIPESGAVVPPGAYTLYGAMVPAGMDLIEAVGANSAILDSALFTVE